MSVTIRDLEELKAKAERLRQSADRAQGALDGALGQLKSQFDMDSEAAAQELLEELRTAAAESQAKFEKAYQAHKEKWGDF